MTVDQARMLTLRPYQPGDLAWVRALHVASFAALGRGHHDDRQIAAHTQLIEALYYADDLAASHVSLAVDATGALIATTGWIAHAARPGTARIRKVFVDPGWVRRGIATRMVEDAERRALEAGFARYFVRANLNAVPLYAKLGYVALEEGVMTTPSGVDLPVVLMSKG